MLLLTLLLKVQQQGRQQQMLQLTTKANSLLRSSISSIDRKPWIALVCCPSRVLKLSTGSA